MKSLAYLNKYFYKYRYRLVIGLVFVIAANLFSAFPAKAVSYAVDAVVNALKEYDKTADASTRNSIITEISKQIVYFALIITGLTLIRGLFMFMMRQSIIVMSRLIEFDLKNDIYGHYQQLSISFYHQNKTGDLMARISEDVSRVRMYIGPAIMYFTNLIATFIVVIPIIFALHTRLAIFVLLPLPVLSFAIFKVNNIINRKSDEIQGSLSSLTSFVQETFSGIRIIKAFGVEKLFRSAFLNSAVDYKSKSLALAKVDATFFPLMTFLTGLSTIVAVVVGGYFVLIDEITIGNIAELVIYVNLLTWPVTSLGWTSSLVQRAAASQHRINEFLQQQPEITNPSEAPFAFTDAITVEALTFTYPGKEIPALNNISFQIKKGQTVAILGTTGSGKSTLVQLLLRVMDVKQGRILVDQQPLNEINLKAYKQSIGYVPQDVFLFSDSILNNIAFGINKQVDKEVIELASKQAALHETIIGFKDGYDTILGERGISLSGGQKQRLSIARALIKNPDILIMDDCFSALDTQTESEILGQLKQYIKNRTTILISHRVSTAKDADFILFLDEGKIIESGPHNDLLKLNGNYAALFQSQLSKSSDNY
ncbi:MAG: ABC transporter ATP-binding protein/permease [Bacteroidia bacterium]|jgi:ATP-binding cassette subfamily B protein|nr:ABC transporter ATP-binding protein/permease [Bacteroidia bacterium]